MQASPPPLICPSYIHVLYSHQNLAVKHPQFKIHGLNWINIYVVVLEVMIP